MSITLFNNGFMICFGGYSATNNRYFIYPMAFKQVLSVQCTDITPDGFDSYTCVTYLWGESSNNTQAHVITTQRNTPGGYIFAVGTF